MKQRKQKLKALQEAARPDVIDDEIKEPKVKNKSVSNVGQINLEFDQRMLFDEVFAGMNFTKPAAEEGVKRRLDNVDLSGFV